MSFLAGELPIIPQALFLALLAFLLTPISLEFESIQRYVSIKWMDISFERKFSGWKFREPGEKPRRRSEASRPLTSPPGWRVSGGVRAEFQGEGGGSGGGIRIEPITFIAVKGGDISFRGIRRGGTMEMIVEKIPPMAERVMEKMGDKGTPKRKPREAQERKVAN